MASAAHPILSDMAESVGDPRDLTAQQLLELRRHFNNSLFAFAWTFFNFRDLEGSGYRPVHREICDIIQLWGTPKLPDSPPWHPGDRVMIQVPRGSYKTSLCTISNALWLVSRDPNRTGLICNEVLDNAKKWLRLIREVISTNRLYQAVYRDVLPPGVHWHDRELGKGMPRSWKWSDYEFSLARDTLVPEASLTAAGVGTATTGGHWDFLIKDDLISEEARRSPTLMERARDWFDSSLPLERPAYHGKDLISCTPWSFDDVYRYILEKYDYVLYRRSAIETGPDGADRTLIPKRTNGKGWSLSELRDMQRKRPFYFNAQMMCQPQAGAEQAFQPQWLRYYLLESLPNQAAVIPSDYYNKGCSTRHLPNGQPVEAPPSVDVSWMNRVLLVDPASSDDKTVTFHGQSRTGILVVGMDPWGRRFILDGWAGKANPADVIAKIFLLARKWQVTRCAIEEVTFSVVYQHWLRMECARQGYHLAPIPLKPAGRKKDDRIMQLIPGFQNGLFYLPKGAVIAEQFSREYADFPYAATKDLLDALAYESDVLRKPDLPTNARLLRNLDDEVELGNARRDVTGYGQPYF